jgi:hypothetical protein
MSTQMVDSPIRWMPGRQRPGLKVRMHVEFLRVRRDAMAGDDLPMKEAAALYGMNAKQAQAVLNSYPLQLKKFRTSCERWLERMYPAKAAQ